MKWDLGVWFGVKSIGIIDGILHYVSIAIAIETPFRMTLDRGLDGRTKVRPTEETPFRMTCIPY